MSIVESNDIRSSWGWFLAAGIALVLLGAACIAGSLTATFVTVRVFGWLLLAGAVIALVQASRARKWSGHFSHLLSALFRGFAGYLLLRYPLAGEFGVTMILASLFVVGGLLRATGAAATRSPRAPWSVLSGAVSFVLGVVLLVTLPAASPWFIGFFIGIDLFVDGVVVAALATVIHSSAEMDTFDRA